MATPPLPVPDPPPGADPARLVTAHEAAAAFYRQRLLAADGPRAYLTGRGLGELARPDLPWRHGIDQPWRLGYAPPGWTALTAHLRAAGYTRDELRAAGLARRARTGTLIDTFRDRIMLPIRDSAGQTVAFIGRAAPGAPPDVPKYLNSGDTAIYHKGQILYGLAEQADRLAAGWAPVLVEGPLDALAVWLAHPDHAGLGRVGLAPCGTRLTNQQAAALAALPGAARHGITVAYDNDPAGQAAAGHAYRLLARPAGPDLHAAALPSGADPADLIGHPDTTAGLRAALTHQARPLAQAVIDHTLGQLIGRHPTLLDDAEGRVLAVRAVAPLLTPLDAARSAPLLGYIAAATGTGVDTVTWAVIAAFETPPPKAPRPRADHAPSTKDGSGVARAFPPLRLAPDQPPAGPTQSTPPDPGHGRRAGRHR